jgi:hypothetical protein
VDIASRWLGSTDGYQILWPVLALPILGVIPLVVTLRSAEHQADGPAEPA